MIVAIDGTGCIIAHADTVTECEKATSSLWKLGVVRYRVASPALQAAIEEGHPLDSIEVLVGPDSACLAPSDEDIRRIREHVIARALENTK